MRGLLAVATPLICSPGPQAFYPGPPVYPVWQQMCSVAAAPDAGMYHTNGGSGSGSGLRSNGSGSGCHHSGSGDAVVPCAMPLRGGQDDSIWAEEAVALTHPTMMQVAARPAALPFLQFLLLWASCLSVPVLHSVHTAAVILLRPVEKHRRPASAHLMRVPHRRTTGAAQLPGDVRLHRQPV
jgi:hypothetical protein